MRQEIQIPLDRDYDRIIEMAWEDRTPFDAILFQFNLTESQVIKLMRNTLKPSSFKLWRQRVNSGKESKNIDIKEVIKLKDLNVLDKNHFFK